MISTHWLKKRQPYWSRLEELLELARRKGLRRLDRDELRELGLLYRQTATDLSAVRSDASSRQQALRLNQLLGRAHNTIYSGAKSSLSSLARFYWRDYPRAFRAQFNYTALATAITLLTAAIGMAMSLAHPEFMRSFLGDEMMAYIQRHEMWTKSIVGLSPQSTSEIATNNLSVSFMAYAGGMTAGLETLYLIYVNGMMLGVVGVACWSYGMSLPLWSFVAPHGALELPAIFIACGAGLRLAVGMLFPGTRPWRESLAQGGGEATRLMLGVLPLLLIAGCFEGFFSPYSAPAWCKFAVSAFNFTWMNLWLWLGGRERKSNA